MSKRESTALLVFVICLLVSSYAHADSSDLDLSACKSTDDWLVIGIPLDLIELVCTVIDDGFPVSIEENSDSDTEDEPAIQQSDSPGAVKQFLLLLLAVWSPK